MKTKRVLAIVLVLAMTLALMPVAALAAGEQTTTLWSGTASAGGNWWDQVLVANVDGSALTEGGYLSVYHDLQNPGLNVILAGASNGWAQISNIAATASGDGYVTQIDYATLLAAYGAADLSDVTTITIYVSTGETATVTNISYTAAGEDSGEEETKTYGIDLDINWWPNASGTFTVGEPVTLTASIPTDYTMNQFAVSINDAFADLNGTTPYMLVQVDGETIYNGACNYWAEWYDGAQTNNYYVEPFNSYNLDWCEIKSMPASGTLTVTLSLGKPIEEEEAPAAYVVAGTADLCGTEWDASNTDNLMTDEDGDGVYTKVYEDMTEGWPNFKVVEILSDGTQNWLTDAANGTDNMWVEAKDGDTLTITYEPATGTITYTIEGVAPPTYVVAGTADLCGTEWDATDENNLMTDEDGDGVYTKIYRNVKEGWPNFKVVEVQARGTQTWLTDAENGTDNMWLETKAGDTVVITYEPATGEITYKRYRIYENAFLCCADDGWWPLVNMETDYKVTTTVTGSGTYTLSWNLNEWGWDPVSGLAVLYIDIANYDMIQMYDVTDVVVKVDGKEVPVTDYNVKVYESDGYYRIELYNMYSGTEGAVASDLAFAENITVSFRLVYTASYGDETNLALIGSLLVVSMLGVVALIVTKKKFA